MCLAGALTECLACQRQRRRRSECGDMRGGLRHFAYSRWMQTYSRSIPLAGASNFRDLGGYIGQDGRALRWRRLFRSDHLAALTTQDNQQLQQLGLVRALDFRGAAERAAQPYALAGLDAVALPIEPTVVQRAKDMAHAGQRMTAPIAQTLMQDTYRAFVSDNRAQFAQFFALLLEQDVPTVFHCTAGKDRTGFAAALLLSALGVSPQVVMQDYLLTNALYQNPWSQPHHPEAEAWQVIWRVQENFLRAALELVERDFGGLPQYLSAQLGLDAAALARLQQLYLSGLN